jgi:hypothetical protein
MLDIFASSVSPSVNMRNDSENGGAGITPLIIAPLRD